MVSRAEMKLAREILDKRWKDVQSGEMNDKGRGGKRSRSLGI